MAAGDRIFNRHLGGVPKETIFGAALAMIMSKRPREQGYRELARQISLRKWRKVTDFAKDSEQSLTDEAWFDEDARDEEQDLNSANIVTSESAIREGRFYPILDLDCEHAYVPSSTSGHGHLYLGVEMDEKTWRRFMKAMEEFGIVGLGYQEAGARRGYDSARLPWVTKTDNYIEAAEKASREGMSN